MLLVGGDEQGGGEAVKAAFFCLPGGLIEPELIAFDAAVFNVISHGSYKGPQTVVVALDERQRNGLGVVPQTVPPGTVFRKGMDIGVIPEPGYIVVISPKHVNALIGAGGAADMQKRIHRFLRRKFDILYSIT